LEALWQQTWTQEFRATSAYILTKYLKASPVAAKNQEIIDEIETQVRLGLGATAPEITWKKEQGLEKLSALNGSERYVLVFWSSTCGHCLKEVPALHEELSTYSDVKVVAVGLEDDDLNWKVESAKLDNFEHVIALGKWESDYAKLYDIHSTPTYFILDENKKIISKPESDKEVVNFLNEN
jgi:thiol-disulfide isomerase/thioredoxin